MKRKTISGGSMIMVPVIVASGLLMTVLGQRQYVRLTTDEAWVAKSALNPGQVIQPNDLIKARVGDDLENAINNPNAVVGKQLAVQKDEGDIFYPSDFVSPEKTWMTSAVPEGRVVYTLVPDKYLLPYSKQLRRGDRFDILVTAPGGQVYPLAFDVVILGALQNNPSPQDGQSGRSMITALAAPPDKKKEDQASGNNLLLLAVKPEHVVPLASAQGGPGRISFVVHGEKEVSEGKQLTVIPKTRSVEVYSGLDKSQVRVGG
jgi:hypothetical protein